MLPDTSIVRQKELASAPNQSANSGRTGNASQRHRVRTSLKSVSTVPSAVHLPHTESVTMPSIASSLESRTERTRTSMWSTVFDVDPSLLRNSRVASDTWIGIMLLGTDPAGDRTGGLNFHSPAGLWISRI